MRHIILHNHLFKNAGTSVDHILRQNFGNRWQSAEFCETKTSNSPLVAAWIKENPKAVAFSSHTLMGPLPRVEDTSIIPVTLLRDPVERIASAYRFEHMQDAQTKGALLAKRHGFAGYVHARLLIKGDRQCRNFQTSRLASLVPDMAGSELDRAYAALKLISHNGVLGLVAEFDKAMDHLRVLISPYHPGFTWQPVNANASGPSVIQTVSPDMRQILMETNQDDLALLAYARDLLRQTPTGVRTPQAAGTG